MSLREKIEHLAYLHHDHPEVLRQELEALLASVHEWERAYVAFAVMKAQAAAEKHRRLSVQLEQAQRALERRRAEYEKTKEHVAAVERWRADACVSVEDLFDKRHK